MVAQKMSKVRSAEMIIQHNLGRPFRAVTFENFGSVTLKFFSACPFPAKFRAPYAERVPVDL